MPKKIDALLKFGDENFEPDNPAHIKQRVDLILKKNENKDFVQRIIDPTTVNSYVFPKDSDRFGQTGTHLMSYSSYDKGAFVYPEIINDKGVLKRLSRKEAAEYALRTGEYIHFDTEDEAKWFGENYKINWKGNFIKAR